MGCGWIFNDNLLKIRVKRCVRTAIKLRKKYFYKDSKAGRLLCFGYHDGYFLQWEYTSRYSKRRQTYQMKSISGRKVQDVSTRNGSGAAIFDDKLDFVNDLESAETRVLRCNFLRIWTIEENRCITALGSESKK
ncbi:hypothetical protein RJ639_046740 [Escallonia herrerae]|uniref:Uncharacterized protein n=1 Tax=Escallonia herrerae TaxID=1293975 RepID=A0AA88W9N3_9ASTE|nr:hypothetical protein RJ639_046740 [Escallonia herrerae]